MDILKKHWISIVFGVVCLIAIIATFFPLGGNFEALRKDAGERAALGPKAKALTKKERFTPPMDLISATQPIKINVFPSKQLIDEIQTYLSKLTKQGGDVFDAAKKLNKLEFSGQSYATLAKLPDDQREKLLKKLELRLVPESLPVPGGDSEIHFRTRLAAELVRLRTEVLRAGYQPSAEDFTKADALITAEIEKGRKKDVNDNAIENALREARAKIPERLNRELADKARLYMAPITMPQFPDVTGNAAVVVTPASIYFAQASLWVIEDVCQVIADVNANSKSIRESPIKHIRNFTIAPGVAMYYRPNIGGTDPNAASADPAVPAPAPSAGTSAGDIGVPHSQEPARDFKTSVSGRYSNAMYDVITFTLTMDVDQRQISKILKQFSTYRFITVRNVEFMRIDSIALAKDGFVYGNAPVAQIKLDLEVLQMRDWTAAIMPRSVKDLLIGPGKEYEVIGAEKKDEAAAVPSATGN